MQDPSNDLNARAIDALIATATEAEFSKSYIAALEGIRRIAADTARMVAELDPDETRDAA